MAAERITAEEGLKVDPKLLQMLNKGLEDIEAGRTLSHREAMEEARRIAEDHRLKRTRNVQAAVNA